MGAIGIDGSEVYTLVYNRLCAVVHSCPAKSYQSEDGALTASWVLAHHQVVDAAWRRWGTVVPLTFNTIIAAGQESADKNLGDWLEKEHESLEGRLDTLSGKTEYGVQVFWDPALIAREVVESSRETRELEEEIRSKPRGIAYMYRQRLESLVKKEMEARASNEFKELYGRLTRCVDNIRVEKTKDGEEGRQMLMNLSCLVSSQRYPDLEAELDSVRRTQGYTVRLAGPLPPYSFV